MKKTYIETSVEEYLEHLPSEKLKEVEHELNTNSAFKIQLEEAIVNLGQLVAVLLTYQTDEMEETIGKFFAMLPTMHPMTMDMHRFYLEHPRLPSDCSLLYGVDIEIAVEELTMLKEHIYSEFEIVIEKRKLIKVH